VVEVRYGQANIGDRVRTIGFNVPAYGRKLTAVSAWDAFDPSRSIASLHCRSTTRRLIRRRRAHGYALSAYSYSKPKCTAVTVQDGSGEVVFQQWVRSDLSTWTIVNTE